MTPYQFFLRNAGFSYDPKTETADDGRRRHARDLANAERRGARAELSFGWSIDPDNDSSEWCDEPPAYEQWACVCRDANGIAVASLGGIDFGRDGLPYSDPYRRVVEAELAQEALT